MDKFLVIYNFNGKKQYSIVFANNTLHAKDILEKELFGNIIKFIEVDFATEEDLTNFSIFNPPIKHDLSPYIHGPFLYDTNKWTEWFFSSNQTGE